MTSERQLQETLANLGTDYLDVYLMHNLRWQEDGSVR